MSKRSSPRIFARNLLVSLALTAIPLGASAQTVWTGAAGDGAFTNPLNWTAGVPSSSVDATIATGTSVHPTTVSLNGGGSVDNLTLAAFNNLNLLDAASLTLTLGSTATNGGSIALMGTGDSTSLYLGNGAGTTTLTGGGTLTLSNTLHNGNTFIYGDNGVVLDNVNNTISGEGLIGAAHAMGYINGGSAVVDANVSGESLTFNLGGSLLTNNNLLEATNGGSLVLLNQVVGNSGATIKASGTGSQVVLNAATIHGGSLTGAVTANTNSVLDGTTSDGITVNNLTISDGSFVTVAGTVHNTGTITLASTGDQTSLYAGNGAVTTTLTGGGTVTLSDSAHNGEAIVFGDNGDTLDNSNNTLQGEGLIGDGHAMAYTNEAGALVDANVSGQAIAFNLGGQILTNKNVLEATNGGLLQFNNVTVNNAAGTISTDTGHGSQITLSTSTIQAGTLNGPVTVADSSTLDGQTLGTLTNAGSVGVSNGVTLTLMGTINNTGSLSLNSTGNQTTLYVGNGPAVVTTLKGGGTLTLADTAHNGEAILLGDNGATLDNVDNTLQGEGLIGAGHALNVTNEAAGLVDANVSGQALTFNLGGQTLTNKNLLEATKGGTLQITSATVNNSGASITASGANSQLGFSSATVDNAGGSITASGVGTGITLNSATLQGGTVTGTISVLGSSGLDGATDGTLTYAGAATVNDGASLTLTGTVANKGSIALMGTGDSTSLYLGNGAGTTTLTGGGTVTLSNTLHNGNTFIYGDNGVVLDNVNNTISGEGLIGAAHAMGYINGGSAVVDANVSGESLTFNLGGSLLTNNNLLEATNGGSLVLLNQVVGNSGATIKASGTGSQVVLNAATIHGGSLTGAVTANTNSVLDGTTSDGITVNNLTISDGSFVTVAGTVHNTGTITLASTGDQTSLYAGNGAVTTTLTGGGTVTLSDSAHNGEAIVFGDNGDTLDNSNNTLQGEGLIGDGHAMAYTNEAGALVDANVSGQAIAFNLGGQILTNKNVLEATNGGLLQFNNVTVNNAAGTISTDTGHGSQITLSTSTIQAGTLNGPVTVADSSTLDGQTLGTLTNAGSVGVSNGVTLTLMGTINNTGSLSLNSTGNQTTLYVGNGPAVVTTLKGGGTLTLADTAHNGEAILLGDNGATLDNVDNTLQGEGLIGAGHALNVTNEAAGTILANSPGNSLAINLNGGSLTNNGTMQANAGSTLVASGPLTNFSGNTLTGGTYVVNGSSAPGGTGTMQLNLPANTGAEIVNNAATIVLNGPTANTLLQDLNGNTALSALASNSTANSSLTVEGGYSYATAGSFANAGTIHAGSGGTFNASSGLTGTTGTLQIDAGGSASIAGGSNASTTGTLTQNGTLALGSNSITVSTAYTNANFGVGNSFNNHADVTGSGLILAAANTAIGISGSAISNGGSSTPSLAFGNLHLGQSETLDYTITNTGTTGPSVQGAIQTSVNGGNITDSRLSGSGVTAGNYGPLGLGQSSTYAITFSATSAGALAPGQSVHVATNFDNVQAPTIGFSGGAAYQLAEANTLPTPINLGNFHVKDTASQTLTVTNVAPNTSGFTETLGATTTGTTGAATAGGSVIKLAQGSSSNALSVGINTLSAGAQSGTATYAFTSNEINNSGLGTTPLGSQTVSVTANVYNLASASLGSIDFGKVLVGSNLSKFLSITNTAPTGLFSEGLDATLGAFSGQGSGQLSGSGAVSNLAAGSTNSNGLQVTLNATTVGTIDASVLVNLTSDGATTSHLGLTSLGTQSASIVGMVNETVVVGNLASASAATPNPVNLGNVRKGAASPIQFLSISNTATGPAEGLNGSLSTSSPGLSAAGSFTSLQAGDTSSTDLSVSMNTSSAGLKNGTATITLASDGSFNGGVQTALPSQTVNVTGAVYQTAQANALPTSINLGTMRTGTAVATALSIANVAPDTGGYTETLGATFGPVSSGLSGSGSITGLAQGAPASTAMGVSYTAGSAGAFNGSASVNFASQAINSSGLGTYALGSQTVDFTALVNALASLKISEVSGPAFFSTGLDSGTLNFGSVKEGGGSVETLLNLLNNVGGPADDLLGSVDTSKLASTPFTFDGNTSFDLAASEGMGFGISFDENASTGSFTETITFDEASHNAFQSDLELPQYVLTVEGTIRSNVNSVPDSKNTLGLLALGFGGLMLLRRKSRFRMIDFS